MELQAMGLSHCMGTGSRLDFPSEADPPAWQVAAVLSCPIQNPAIRQGLGFVSCGLFARDDSSVP